MLRIVGEFGPHQRKLYVLLSLSIIPAAFQMLIHVFVGARPDWSCSASSKNESCAGNRSGCVGERYASTFTSIVTEVSGIVNFEFMHVFGKIVAARSDVIHRSFVE